MTSRRAGICGLLAVAMFWGSVAAFAALRPEYTHATKAVSELGVFGAPRAAAFNLLGFIAPGILVAMCAARFARVISGRRGILWWLLVLSGASLAGAGMVPGELHDGHVMMDSPFTAGHLVFAAASSFLWVAGACLAIGPLRRRHSQSRFTGWVLPITAFCIAAFAVTIFHSAIPALAVRPGLAQRIGFAGYFAWFAAVALFLIRARDGEPREPARA